MAVPPKPGELRLWTWQSIAHGADAILCFRWRTARIGTELHWHGILEHHGIPGRRYAEVCRVGRELRKISALITGLFREMKFGSIVLSQSYRSPALLAKMAATLQILSGGRLILGLGAGWKQDEYRAYGYEFPETATRIHQLAEVAQIIRLMWTEPRATFQGHYYQVQDAICEPKPEPLPSLLIGGGGKKLTLRVVAQYADWYNYPGGTLEHYRELLSALRGHCAQVGRNYDQIVKTWATDCVAVAPSTEAARRLAQASPFCAPGVSLVGTPDEVAAQLQSFADLGVRHFILRFADFPKMDGALLFAREVTPRLR